jgi:signal transduction histidine kinase/cell division protein FtsL
MKRRLYLKLLLSYLIFFVAALVILTTYTQRQTIAYLEKTEAAKLYREANLLSANYASKYFQDSTAFDTVQIQMETLAAYLSSDIWIVNSQGVILLDSSDASVGERILEPNPELPPACVEGFDIGDFGNKYYKIGTFYDYFSEDVLTVFSPITIGFEQRGYIVIHEKIAQITNTSNGFINVTFYTMGLVFLCSFLILILFSFVVYRPLRKITVAADHYAKGEFDDVIQVHSNDEIGHLANSLNFMAKELGTHEEDQRKFVSNVSHDFRSPLTSIKGYVEAMIDGTIPVEMQGKYLNIILSETERLNKLTQSLLDLNRFGQHGTMLDISDFDINNLIRTTLLTFEGRCNDKGISFDLVLTGEELLVRADMSKIQQVLHNLIDNAVKFSHNNSSISIETRIKNEKVLISVKDTGIGIPADSIKKIWDRFYKTDLSRGKDKKGTGLGLSIVKEIIQAHQENINVVSTEGVGTEFIFTLPLSEKDKH